jgi:hypothetical protein
MYLNQQRDRDDVLDFKQVIGAGNIVSLSRPGIRTHQASQAKQHHIVSSLTLPLVVLLLIYRLDYAHHTMLIYLGFGLNQS